MRLRNFWILPILLIIGTFLLSAPAEALMVDFSTADLVDRSDAIVRGYVTGIESVPQENQTDFVTWVTLFVSEHIKGSTPDLVEIQIPGGGMDNRFMFVTDHPNFEPGQEVILFLDETRSRIVGQIQGKQTIDRGLILERQIDAQQYIDALYDLADGLLPAIDPDASLFRPISTIQGYLDRQILPQFGYGGLHWSGHEVDLRINENDEDGTGEGEAVKKGMQAWTNAPADFVFKFAGTHSRTGREKGNTINEVLWADVSGTGAIAYTVIWSSGSQVVECDLIFLNEFKWSTKDSPSGSEMDVQAIAAHELGHFLVLGDLYDFDDREKTMYGYGSEGETKARSLHQDDIDGIVHIYGSGPGSSDDDDDDSGGGGGNPSDGLNTDACEELAQVIYNHCELYVSNGGGSRLSEEEAVESCDFGGSNISWTCVDVCVGDSDECAGLEKCIRETCNVNISEDSSDSDDDDGGGGFCG
jgi:Matrixin